MYMLNRNIHVFLVTLLFLTAAADATTQEVSEAFLTWARGNAIPITTIQPGHGFEDLQPLKELVGNARIVGLGESLHGVHEFFEVRHRLFEFLVEEMGFTAFAGETGLVEAVRVNDYVLGRADEPEQMSDWFNGGFRDWEEVKTLVRWMRRYNQNPNHSRKLHFYGIDVNTWYTSPLAALEGAWTYLDEVDSRYAAESRQVLLPLVEPFLEQGEGLRASVAGRQREDMYTRLSMEGRAAYTAAVADLVARFETRELDYLSRSSEEAYQWAYRHAIVARQLDQQFRALAPAGVPQDGRGQIASVRPALARYARLRPAEARYARERAMVDNLLWALEREDPEGRIVMWNHNAHLRKFPHPLGHESMGQFLDSRIGGNYVNIGFTYYQGDQSGWASYQSEVSRPAKPKSLDGELARMGLPMFILNLRAAPKDGPVYEWLNRVWEHRESIPQYFSVNPLQAFDALFFIDHISPVQVPGANEIGC